jgi:hypothetical protein
MYAGVPSTVCGFVAVMVSAVTSACGSAARIEASPKSSTFTEPSTCTLMLERLEVSVDHAAMMGGLQRVSDLTRKAQRLGEWQTPPVP